MTRCFTETRRFSNRNAAEISGISAGVQNTLDKNQNQRLCDFSHPHAVRRAIDLRFNENFQKIEIKFSASCFMLENL